ncbi:putative integral membrane protein [Colletotrichum sublineola]|uniref:Putative integral membrane protein n=1 Tax=Colletotrichum sublineola TaxID=1173701 RepID=A0A066WWF0_COLSU|nr:putative integral membrane protein [Colletotrichum sublineola]
MSDAASPVGAFPPPPGVVPNFENPRDAGWMLNVVGMSVMMGVTTIFFVIRAYVKFFHSSSLLPEDWTCAASYVLILLYGASVFVMAHYGEGYHAWEITKEAYREVMRWLYASSLIYNPAAYFTKVTLLLFEARVFEIHERTSRGIRIFIVALFIGYIPLQTMKTVICLPISSFWDPGITKPKCFNQRKLFFADLSLAILSDVVILVLPIPLLWGLHMPLWKKVKILTLLGAGGIATAVTVYRLYLVIQFLDSKDVTADFVTLDLVTSSYLWSLMTGKQTTSAPTESPTAERTSSRQFRTNFDTELAILSGQSIAENPQKDEQGTVTAQHAENWGCKPRINSIDGRQEGWLVTGAESSTQGERIPRWKHHEIEARKSWEAVWERAVLAGNLPPIPEDSSPPRLKLTTHPPSDWGIPGPR